MKTTTIGGDRLGAGKKMKQSYHEYERSNHDLSYVWKSSMAPGVLIPFMSQPLLPGDTFDIDLNTMSLTHPTVGPLFGSYKLQLDVFMIPVRLYQAKLHNNALKIGYNMGSIRLPEMYFPINTLNPALKTPLEQQQINQSALLAYLGVRGVGRPNDPEDPAGTWGRFNAIPVFAYYDIYKNYYANNQEEVGVIVDYAEEYPIAGIDFKGITGPTGTVNLPTAAYGAQVVSLVESAGTALEKDNIYVLIKRSAEGETEEYEWDEVMRLTTITDIEGVRTISGIVIEEFRAEDAMGYPQIFDFIVKRTIPIDVEPQLTTFPLQNLDDMREDILAEIKNPLPFTIGQTTYAPYGNLFKSIEGNVPDHMIRSVFPMQGLAVKTYQSDMYNNWMNTEYIEGVGEQSAVDVSDGTLQMDALNLAQKMYNMLNRIAISGGTYYDWLEAVYTEGKVNHCETPMYMGGLSKEIVFQEVISNSATAEEPLGTLAGRGVQSAKHKGGKIIVKANKEICYIMGIVSITPRLDYSQGNNWDMNLRSINDFHKPALDGIGFQDLVTDGMAAWDTKRDGETGLPIYNAIGKQPAWINYMTAVNKTYGSFADLEDEMFMTLNRRYTYDAEGNIQDATTYIDPAKYNYVFANTRRNAQNFWITIGIDISARRKVSAKQIPNL